MPSHDSADTPGRILAEAPVHGQPHALFFPGKTGTIRCTPTHIRFDGSGRKATISRADISSVDYEEPTWSKAYLFSGLAALAYWVLGSGDSGLGTMAFLVGIVLLITGYFLRTSRLTIHTPHKTYEYVSRGDGLGKIVREYRMSDDPA